MTAQGIFSALKEPFNKNIIISLRSVLVTSLVLYSMFWTNFDIKSMICISIQGEGKIRMVLTVIFGAQTQRILPAWLTRESISQLHTFHNDGANYWPVDLMTLRLLLLNATQRPKGMAIGGRVLNPVLWSPDHQNTKSPDHQNTTGPRVQPKYLILSHQAFHLFTDFPLWRKLKYYKNHNENENTIRDECNTTTQNCFHCFHCFVAKSGLYGVE